MNAIGVDSASEPNNGSADKTDPFRVRACAEELPFVDASADGVLAECCLSVMHNAQKVLAECARVLRPGGQLMISDLYARNPKAIEAVRKLTGSCVTGMIVRDELEIWLQANGFAPHDFEDHSRTLREAVARFIFDHDSMAELWECGAHASDAQEIADAMKEVRAGYFLLIATRVEEPVKERGERDGR
jgi:ubiquinone/menaquinone biosynthesis C-methylase UbiE